MSWLTVAWLLVGLWLLAYGVLKAQGLQGLDVDSAEQVYFAQSWQMGYGVRQPPLYTWLLMALKPAAWPWAFMLELMRYALLLAWLAGVQALARMCGATRQGQALVLLAHLGLSLALWRVHDSLTHTVLAVVLVTWGSVAVVAALQRPVWWLLAGVLAGLACLSKFNAGLWWGAAVAAAWYAAWRGRGSQGAAAPYPSLRPTVAWSLGASGVAAVVGSPYGAWWLAAQAARQGKATSLVREIAVGQEHAPLWRPLADVASAVIEYALLGPLLLAVVGGVACLMSRYLAGQGKAGAPEAPMPACTLGQRWLAWQSGLALLATAAVLVLVQGSAFKARWLWPVVPGLGVCLVLMAWRGVSASSRRWGQPLMAAALFSAALSIALSALRWWEPGLNAQRCRECWTDRPAEAMAGLLHRQEGPSLRVIAGDTHLAGVLAAASPGIRTWGATMPQWPAPVGFAAAATPCVLAWVDVGQPLPPPEPLRSLIKAHARPNAPNRAAWPLRHAPERQVWLQFQRLAPEACALAAPFADTSSAPSAAQP